MVDPDSIKIAHAIDGRVRLRVPSLRQQRVVAEEIADHLAGLDGIQEVQVRPLTGSILCLYEPSQTAVEAIVAAVREKCRASVVSDDGADASRRTKRVPVTDDRSSVARALGKSVRDVNRDLLEVTGGRLDLATAAVVAFLSAGAAEIAFTRNVPAPPWFNLAWWALQTFMTFEREGNGDAGTPSD